LRLRTPNGAEHGYGTLIGRPEAAEITLWTPTPPIPEARLMGVWAEPPAARELMRWQPAGWPERHVAMNGWPEALWVITGETLWMGGLLPGASMSLEASGEALCRKLHPQVPKPELRQQDRPVPKAEPRRALWPSAVETQRSIAVWAEAGREVQPFCGTLAGASFRELQQAGLTCLAGHIPLGEGKGVYLTGIRAEHGWRPPPHLADFNHYLPVREGVGYWVRYTVVG